ncbi:MAG: CGNR zinc finger domain-containing protein [Longimicrobiales bacterium]
MESETYEPIESIDFIGGAVCLDFVNTASARQAGPFRERLHGYRDLVTWGERVGLVSSEHGVALRAEAAGRPAEAEAALERGRALREAVYRVFSAQSQGQPPAGTDLDTLTREYAEAASHRRLTCDSERVELEWEQESGYLDQVLWPVAQSAIELLVSDERARVKECATDNCNWLFLDASKNRSRRWCEMRECGNRAKARRHYARVRKTKENP